MVKRNKKAATELAIHFIGSLRENVQAGKCVDLTGKRGRE